jgi:hypothetical protein
MLVVGEQAFTGVLAHFPVLAAGVAQEMALL